MPAKHNLSKKRGKAKTKVAEKRKQLMNKMLDSRSEELDVKIAIIQELIPLGLERVAEELQKEVRELAGKRYQHDSENVRWGKQPGSIYLRDQKLPILVPRVRHLPTDKEIRLKTYEKFQQAFDGDQQTFLKLLNGISTHKYRESAELVPEVFGISATNLSKRFKVKSSASLEKLQNRSLSEYDFLCVFIDGKRYAKDGLLVAMGVSIDGIKIILGIEQSHSENTRVAEQFLDKLIDRGLRSEDGILFIIDGSKGIRRAIENRLGERAFIQRCQWHKRENIVAYLNDGQQEVFRRKMQEAYQQTTYPEAKAALEKISQELSKINQSAADSLAEGLEETLTLHRLGLSTELSKSLSTTNCLESVMSQLGQFTDKVDRWHNSGQILRWSSAALLVIEPRLRKIKGFHYLKILRYKMQEEIRKRHEQQSLLKQNQVLVSV